MSPMASQITGVSIVCSAVCSGADQRKHQSSASMTFIRGIHRWPVNSPHKGPITRKMFTFDDIIMLFGTFQDIMSLNYLNNETTIDMSAFHEHPELEIQHSDVRIAEKQYPCCPDTTYQSYEISLTVGMRRHGRDRGERNDVPGARGQRWEEEEEPRLDMMRGYN